MRALILDLVNFLIAVGLWSSGIINAADVAGRLPRGPAPSSSATASPLASGSPAASPALSSAQGAIPSLLPSASMTPMPSPSPSEVPAPAAAEKLDLKKCWGNFVNQTNGNMVIQGQDAYILRRVARASASTTGDTGSGAYKYILYKITLDQVITKNRRPKIEKLLAFTGQRELALLVHDAPATGFSFLGFTELTNYCIAGQASGVTIPVRSGLRKSLRPAQTIPLSEYRVVESTVGQLFFEPTKNLLRTVEAKSMRQRVLYQLSKGEMPLFWDDARKIMYSWRQDGGRELRRSGSVASLGLGKLDIGRGDRLIQDRDRFALVRINALANTIGIAQLFGWSGSPKNIVHSLRLPQGMFANQASIRASFRQNLALVFQSPAEEQSNLAQWKKIFVYQLGVGLLDSAPMAANDIVASSGFTEGSPPYGVLLTESRIDGTDQNLKLWDIQNKAWIDLHFD